MNMRKADYLVASMIAALALLAACGSPIPKKIMVKTETVSHTVLFDEGRTSISEEEYEALTMFVHSARPASVSGAVIVADTSRPKPAAHVKWLRAYLIKQGISHHAVRVEKANGGDPHAVILTLRYVKVLAPGPCPDWSFNPVANYDNPDFSNMGCSTENNLAVQVSNPEDLVRGHGDRGSISLRDSVVVQGYMAGSAPGGGGGSSSSSSSSASR